MSLLVPHSRRPLHGCLWPCPVTCGMSLGYADMQAAVNRLNMPREPLETFTRRVGVDE